MRTATKSINLISKSSTDYFNGGIVVCAHEQFVPCVPVRFFFFTAAHFHLAGS